MFNFRERQENPILIEILTTQIKTILTIKQNEIKSLRDEIEKLKKQNEELSNSIIITGDTSDGYHTFNELYEFRKLYNALIFNEWATQNKYGVHKSWRHHDGELCFGGEWFIVSANLPSGQISNHYKAEDWHLFKIPESSTALFAFDGHQSQDVIERIKTELKSISMKEEQNRSYGRKAVGIGFNPSNDDNVSKCKIKFAEIIDLINDLRETTDSQEVKRMCSVAITEAQTAQMWAVKAITWQD